MKCVVKFDSHIEWQNKIYGDFYWQPWLLWWGTAEVECLWTHSTFTCSGCTFMEFIYCSVLLEQTSVNVQGPHTVDETHSTAPSPDPGKAQQGEPSSHSLVIWLDDVSAWIYVWNFLHGKLILHGNTSMNNAHFHKWMIRAMPQMGPTSVEAETELPITIFKHTFEVALWNEWHFQTTWGVPHQSLIQIERTSFLPRAQILGRSQWECY